jgi:hypothetical protein
MPEQYYVGPGGIVRDQLVAQQQGHHGTACHKCTGLELEQTPAVAQAALWRHG